MDHIKWQQEFKGANLKMPSVLFVMPDRCIAVTDVLHSSHKSKNRKFGLIFLKIISTISGSLAPWRMYQVGVSQVHSSWYTESNLKKKILRPVISSDT
jgi:hypothetical protein